MADIPRFTITKDGRKEIAKAIPQGDSIIAGFFRFGEGGKVEVAPGVFAPKEPDPELTDIEAQGFGVNGLFRFEDDFGSGDVSIVSETKVRMEARIESAEGNDRGDGDPPELYEVGYYTEAGKLLIYGTFPKVEKILGLTLVSPIRLNI